MKPKLLLRIAAILILIHAVLHTLAHLQWKDAPEPERQVVIAQMVGHKVPFMGVSRSIGEYYEGFGYAATLAMLLAVYLLWALSTSVSDVAKKVVLAVSVFLLFWSVIELIYFFPFAAGLSLVAAALSFCAGLQIKLPKQP
jgi:hypothetical protein